MTDHCPDCGREKAESVDEGRGRCKAHLPNLPAQSLCKDLVVKKLRRELAEANGKLEARVAVEATSARKALEQLDHLRASGHAKLMYPSEDWAIRMALEFADSQLAATQRAVRTLEWLACSEDEKERLARADGAFELAVHHQQFAEWFRAGTPVQRLRGTDGRTLVAHIIDGLVVTHGDALADPDALFAVAHSCCEKLAVEFDATVAAAQRVVELNAAERAVVDAALSSEQRGIDAQEHPDRGFGWAEKRKLEIQAQHELAKAARALLSLRAAAKPSAAEGEG